MKDISADDVFKLLEAIARLLELKGENPFKIRAYTNGVRALEAYPGDLLETAREDRLAEIDGIGKAISQKVHDYVTTGSLPYYEALADEFPEDIFKLFELQGLGAKKIKILYDKLDISSVARLERACKKGQVAELEGFGPKSADNILKAIDQHRKHVGLFLLGTVYPVADEIIDYLRTHPAVGLASVAGSCRRRKEVLHDLDFLVASREPKAVMDHFLKYELIDDVTVNGETKSSVRLASGLQCDLRVVTSMEFPFALAYFTGSKEHNIALRGRALKLGWTMNEYRFSPVDKDGVEVKNIPEIRSEHDIYKALGLDYVVPELREDRGEILAAENGSLPDLIELENLRGTFHNHTTQSDGRHSLREMVQAADDLGLQYLGIADHSKSSVVANGLDENRLRQQIKEIAALNAESDGLRVFAGTECDILKDGTLDFDDDLLGELDYVVASVHSSFGLGEAEMTKRIIRAIENPHITMLGHLTGRLLLTRESYHVNVPAVIDAAAETGTIIELNANPRRLDMDWRWWPRARDKGVKCAINPDAHSTDGLQNLVFGVAAARKGWLTRKDVVNCLPLGKIETALATKRSG